MGFEKTSTESKMLFMLYNRHDLSAYIETLNHRLCLSRGVAKSNWKSCFDIFM